MEAPSVNDNGTGGLIVTILFYFISKVTLSDVAMFATIAAGLSTALANGYRWYTEYNKSKKHKR
jgi:hypothetical protein